MNLEGEEWQPNPELQGRLTVFEQDGCTRQDPRSCSQGKIASGQAMAGCEWLVGYRI
jgi:hypothetical protein